jgi:predicted MPP superfamily phosphohydrolase
MQVMAATAAGAFVGAGGIGIHDRLRTTVTRETLPVTGLPAGFESFRIALLTDFHRSGLVSEDQIAGVVALAMAERPDLIVLGGDYVTQFDTRFAGSIAELLSILGAPAGVIAVLGNHDDERVVPAALAKRGIRVLRNGRTRLTIGGDSVDFLGIDFWTRNGADIGRLVDPAATPLLVAHDPRRITEAAELSIPLVLSGHTHGGQVVLPALGAVNRFRFPVVAGSVRQGASTLFVSRGIGTIYLPIRINCPPEVAILTLTRAAA